MIQSNKSIVFKAIALLLLISCVFGLAFPASATTSSSTDLSTDVSLFAGMQNSGLKVSYIWDDNDAVGNGLDFTETFGAYATATADTENSIIIAKARGWILDEADRNATTLTLTMANGAEDPKTLEFTLTEVTVGGSVVIKFNGAE